MTHLGRKSRYFLLSYAHSPPVPGQLEGDPDQWVRRFFTDLSAAVAERGGTDPDLLPGWYDQNIPLEADWKTEITEALETARVFVPLYSRNYFNRSRTGREWACFYERMLAQRPADPFAKVQPVLWTPLRHDQPRQGLASALELAAGDRNYIRNGLQGMLRLRQYRADYEIIVNRLADRIVTLTYEDPILPSPVAEVPDIDQIVSPFAPELDSMPFSVMVAAPAQDGLPDGAPKLAYGKSGAHWRPFFTEQTKPLANLAIDQAERLDFVGTVTSVVMVPQTSHEHPGVVLIDPWFLAQEAGPERLQTLLAGLPPWVLPMVVSTPSEDFRKTLLLAEAKAIVSSTGSVHTEPALTAAEGVDSLQAFIALMPFMVADAERHYLRHSSGSRSTRPRSDPGSRQDPIEDIDSRRNGDG